MSGSKFRSYQYLRKSHLEVAFHFLAGLACLTGFRGYNEPMPYLIDGHNLIPKLGLRLDSLDDELELINILQEYCRIERKQVEVYFDGAPASQAGTRKVGTVTAHFVVRGMTADDAIRQRLKRMGKTARTWTVVTSD